MPTITPKQAKEAFRMEREGYTWKRIIEHFGCDGVKLHQAVRAYESGLLGKVVVTADEELESAKESAYALFQLAFEQAKETKQAAHIKAAASAFERLAKLRGWDMPFRQEVTGKDGAPLNRDAGAELLASLSNLVTNKEAADKSRKEVAGK